MYWFVIWHDDITSGNSENNNHYENRNGDEDNNDYARVKMMIITQLKITAIIVMIMVIVYTILL